MSRLRRAVAIAAVLVAASAQPAAAHEGNPDYRSVVNGVFPNIQGLQVQVLGYDNQLELVNKTGKPVVIRDYNGYPYAELLPNGTVEQNKNSPAVYLNQDRFATTPVPKSVTGKGAPQWQVIDQSGRFVWHDHRMHWMAHTIPSQVKDKHKKTKIFDYTIPVSVGGKPAAINGTLFWAGQPKGFPAAAIVALIVIALLGIALVWFIRRRRTADEREATPRGAAEAW
ncbi:MAG: hypothetical protein JOZ25_03440 [Actinobacteria bacterium]|nr:hypothetical protein [Actinomycetota bacterium]